MRFFTRKMKRLRPMQMLLFYYGGILLVDDEPTGEVISSLKSMLLLRQVQDEWWKEYYGVIEGQLGRKPSILVSIAKKANNGNLQTFCGQNNIRIYEVEPECITKASKLANASSMLPSTILLLDVGVKFVENDALTIFNSMTEFERDQNLGMLLSKQRRGAILAKDAMVGALGSAVAHSRWMNKLKDAVLNWPESFDGGSTFPELISLLEEQLKKGRYRVKNIPDARDF